MFTYIKCRDQDGAFFVMFYEDELNIRIGKRILREQKDPAVVGDNWGAFDMTERQADELQDVVGGERVNDS